MKPGESLRNTLGRIDGRGYTAYKEIAGSYGYAGFELFIDHVQGDPFASPSKVRVRLPQERAGFPPALYHGRSRRVALCDYLARQVERAIRQEVADRRGSGHSGLIAVDAPGQAVLERTAVLVTPNFVEARLAVGLPAAGRRVLGRQAEEMFFEDLPAIAREALCFHALDPEEVRKHVELAEDSDFLRSALPSLGLVAFIPDGAVLPRESGVSDRPRKGPNVVPFETPPSLAVEVELPNRGRIRGMGIPETTPCRAFSKSRRP